MMRECQSALLSTASYQLTPKTTWWSLFCSYTEVSAWQGRGKTRRLCISSSLVWGPTLPAVLAGGWGKAPTLAGQPHTPTEPLPAQLSALRSGYEDPTSSSLAPLSLSQDLSVISEPFSLVGIFHTEAISNQRERTFSPLPLPVKAGGLRHFNSFHIPRSKYIISAQ